jgi:hypothetical protein
MTKRFWMSWNEPAQDYRPLNYPPNASILGWWCSGYDGDGVVSMICAWVAAEDEDAAKAAVVLDWPGDKSWRFCDEVAMDWRPNNRFPLSAWSKERVGL